MPDDEMTSRTSSAGHVFPVGWSVALAAGKLMRRNEPQRLTGSRTTWYFTVTYAAIKCNGNAFNNNAKAHKLLIIIMTPTISH